MICAACGEDAPTAPCAACGADPLLDGRYRLDGVLGQGSAGTTFRAVRIADERVVAIKEMPLRRGDTGKAQEMFAREARVLRQLHHPQIPQYVDDLVAGRGRHAALYLVQELIEGVDLAREMEGRRYDEGEVLDIVEALLPVLAYLHTRSPPVIHRDVKPRNVIRRPDGTLVLLDFGAVRDALADPELGGSTVAGTLGYMAPEQFRGDAEPASDIYGLGALAVALLTRRDPNTLTDASGVLVWAPHARPSLPVARLLGRMLARDPADRPGDAAALAAEIRRMRTSPTRAVDEPPSRGAARPAVPERSPAGPVAAPEPERWGPRLPEAPRAPHAERLEILEPAPPFQPPVVEELAAFAARRARERRDANDRARGPLLVVLGIVLVGALVVGLQIVHSAFRSPPAPKPVPVALPTPISAPPATCHVATRAPVTDEPDGTSRYQFVGATKDGSRVALALARKSDRRGEVIVYDAGARRMVTERIAAPDTLTGSWDHVFAMVLGPVLPELEKLDVDLSLRPTPLSWCQDGASVKIGEKDWSFRTFEEPCGLGSGHNVTFELCPAGATDASACIVPPKLTAACWSDEPRLVDLYGIGNAVWAIAERPHGDTLPRFAGGIVVE